MRPIPLIALKDDIIIRRGTLDNDNQFLVTASAAVSFVRCDEVTSRQKIAEANGDGKDDQLILFIDCVNSQFSTLMIPTKGDEVEYKTRKYVVRTVKDFSPHHYEVMLK